MRPEFKNSVQNSIKAMTNISLSKQYLGSKFNCKVPCLYLHRFCPGKYDLKGISHKLG